MEQKKTAKFGSRWGFILAAVGSAVGMANVWGFPAKMGTNGGGAFLVAYLIFVALFSAVGLSAEYAIGRRSRTGTLGSYQAAWATKGAKLGKAGRVVGSMTERSGNNAKSRAITKAGLRFSPLSDARA